jgi:transcriptional regulator with XRE-family HTH domain
MIRQSTRPPASNPPLFDSIQRVPAIGSHPLRPRIAGNLLGELLRSARRQSAVSQLELALRIGVSQRHVAFVEGGRSRPSRELLISWMTEADAPSWLRNAALHQAGFAPVQQRRVGTKPVLSTDALAIMTLQEPNPAIIFDPDWWIAGMNRAAEWLCSIVMPEVFGSPDSSSAGIDMIAAVQHADGLLSRMQDPSSFSAAMLAQLLAEATVSAELVERVAIFAKYHVARFGELDASVRDPGRPVMMPSFETEFGRLSFLTAQGIFGLPQDMTPTAQRFEIWHPLDDHTRGVMREKPAVRAQRRKADVAAR